MKNHPWLTFFIALSAIGAAQNITLAILDYKKRSKELPNTFGRVIEQ